MSVQTVALEVLVRPKGPTDPPEATALVVGNRDDTKEYPHFATWRKYTILFMVSWMTLVMTFATTSILPALPEIAEDFGTTSEILTVTNAGVLATMGVSALLWNPLLRVTGRRPTYLFACFVISVSSIGAAVAKDMPTFVAMRIVAGFASPCFVVAGQTVLADIFEPTSRGRAVGFFMAGSITGPAIGPLIGGIIVSFTNWRPILWLQVGMTCTGFLLAFIFMPNLEDGNPAKNPVIALTPREKLALFNPLGVLRQLIYPNVLLAHLTCGFLAMVQYGFLTSVRFIINPRFHLTTPLVSGLFYIAPGTGFLVGSILGGRLSDRTVKRYIKKRQGSRLAQDRLNSGLIGIFFLLPAAMLVYAWTLQTAVGGLGVPIVSAFVLGVALMGTFNNLNTYASEVLPDYRSEILSGKYLLQYSFAALSSAIIVPLINSIGVGWAFTMLVAFVLIGGVAVLLIVKNGIDMQLWMERLRSEKARNEALA